MNALFLFLNRGQSHEECLGRIVESLEGDIYNFRTNGSFISLAANGFS
jgi:hypothetical protein